MNNTHQGAIDRTSSGNGRRIDYEAAVHQRYEKAAREVEVGLCVPVSYDRSLLEIIPDEIIKKDYGCGDPSRYVKAGETVLDLGSGSGKICYIICQIVGPGGRVIGVDFHEEMLALARTHRHAIGNKLGYHNVEFRRGKIQHLKLDLDLLDAYLACHPVRSVADLSGLREYEERISHERPLIPDESIDVVVSNCVLNLVRPEEKRGLFYEMYRVLRRGGRIAISDIVSDEAIPDHLRTDPELWSGCVSGAFQEEELLLALEAAGFYGIRIEAMRLDPYQTIEGIECHSITLTAYKGKDGSCVERNQAVIYRGPWKQVVDDDNHTLLRGVRTAVCDKTYHIFAKPPYQDQCILVPPREAIPLEQAGVFECARTERRHPRETKGMDYNVTDTTPNLCGPGTDCCS